VLRFAANDWRDEKGVPYLLSAPRFSVDDIPDDARAPHALTWEQQPVLVRAMPAHHQRVILLGVNTGMREREIASLRWEWIREIEGVGLVAVIPARWQGKPIVKGGRRDRVVPLNRICRSVLEDCRGGHDELVVAYEGEAITRVLNTGWKRGRLAAHQEDPSIPADLHVHDLRHTFGHRLEAARVAKETRRTLLGHQGGDITDHYSQDDLLELMAAVEKITTASRSVPVLSIRA